MSNTVENAKTNEFIIAKITVVCPMCSNMFATDYIEHMQDLSINSKVEADLHRVIDDKMVRTALLSMCPACLYTWWFSSFKTHYMLPQLVVDAPSISCSKKFAHAILSGRQFNAHALDTAVLALNGWWLARENDEPAKSVWNWLELSIIELEKALADTTINFNKSRYSYILAELLRQSQDFAKALTYFKQVDKRAMLPTQLVDSQFKLAIDKDSTPKFLSPALIEQIFLPKFVNRDYLQKVS